MHEFFELLKGLAIMAAFVSAVFMFIYCFFE